LRIESEEWHLQEWHSVWQYWSSFSVFSLCWTTRCA